MHRVLVSAFSAVALLVAVAGCAPGTPDHQSWRDDVVRVTEDVGSAVSTLQLALQHRGDQFGPYLQTVAVDAVTQRFAACVRLPRLSLPPYWLCRWSDASQTAGGSVSALDAALIAGGKTTDSQRAACAAKGEECRQRAASEDWRWHVRAELTTHRSRSGAWSFRFRSSDGRILASGEDYLTEEEMERGIEEARAVLRLTETDPSTATPPREPHESRPTNVRSHR
jgi:uncharacterized protein YegP (UPF0339 family)